MKLLKIFQTLFPNYLLQSTSLINDVTMWKIIGSLLSTFIVIPCEGYLFPVSIQFKTNNLKVCTGFIVDAYTIITASRCLDVRYLAVSYPSQEDYLLQVIFQFEVDIMPETLQISFIRSHRKYKYINWETPTERRLHDIGLIKLENKINCSLNFNLLLSNDLKAETHLFVKRIVHEQDLSGDYLVPESIKCIMQKKIEDAETCFSVFGQEPYDNEICAIISDGVILDKGDTGSPVYSIVEKSETHTPVHGVVSRISGEYIIITKINELRGLHLPRIWDEDDRA